MVEWPDRVSGFGTHLGFALQRGFFSKVVAVTYHADLKEVQCDAELVRLLGVESSATPFDRLEWWDGLVNHCGIDPLLAVAHDGADLAVLPLMSSGKGIEALANWYSFHVRPVISPGGDRTVLLEAIAEDLAKRTGALSLAGLPAEDGSAQALARAFRKAGWIVFSEPSDSNHVLYLSGRTFAQYIADRPGSLRTTLKRKAAKLDCQVYERFDDLVWADYEAVYAQSWKPAEASPDFLRAFARAESDAGRVRLGIARHEGRPVATQLWTVEGCTAFIHKLAYLAEARALSPGSVLSAALFAHVIDRDEVSMIDFGTGDDGYKRDWMESVRLRYRLDMFRKEKPQNWPAIARLLVRRLARRVKHG